MTEHRNDDRSDSDRKENDHRKQSDGQDPNHDFVSAQDVADAEDVLFAHPPRRVSRVICGCGESYPCDEVRFALLVKGVA